MDESGASTPKAWPAICGHFVKGFRETNRGFPTLPTRRTVVCPKTQTNSWRDRKCRQRGFPPQKTMKRAAPSCSRGSPFCGQWKLQRLPYGVGLI